MVMVLITTILRTLVGTLWPAYMSFKTIVTKDTQAYIHWMKYWVCFSLFTVCELVADLIIWWIPFYYEAKLLLLAFLLIPQFHGPEYIFKTVIRPTLRHHESTIDKVIEQLNSHVYATMVNGISAVRYKAMEIMLGPSAAAPATPVEEEDEDDMMTPVRPPQDAKRL
ncbi:uncharacterized protein MONBRDRAFT_26609 [Monosiga brevicollis MX1]|uniref:Receptor expression-enhancing protein n=1 Tax=Monosiga brevicollis TaxID=81824 RepID=A9V2V2_MONBE|nr:uncharacterized protein MONBRDRAFT_26609 [Monosiga brevicollis MX1]EDQ87950.1 predicted protein [Monosiga brevicollis MX1]|eukprot:XP_001747026.1 hypothetical protein [Monosiga brevicollis MX1]